MKVIETDRLVLRLLSTDDAEFMLELLTDPGWLRFIGDRGVRTVEGAREYLSNGPIAMYERLGFSMYLTEIKESGAPAGICGLVKRDFLEDVDIGFAFLPAYRGRGYALEAAAAALEHARVALGLERVVAIVTHDNESSARLLEKLGFRFERMVTYPGESQELRLFST